MQAPRHSTLNNVSVARLYDWSEGQKEDVLSVSRIYRDIAAGAGGGGMPLSRNVQEKVGRHPWGVTSSGAGTGVTAWTGGGGGSSSPRQNPGRMFLRDRGMLTKGERQIIQGIYNNRGDLRKYHTNKSSDFFVRNHQDAWLVGKPGLPSNKPSTEVPRESPQGVSLLEVTVPRPANHGNSADSSSCSLHQSFLVDATVGAGLPDESHSITGDPAQRTTCIVCNQEQHMLEQLQKQQQQQKKKITKKYPPPLLSILPPQQNGIVLRPLLINDSFRHPGEELEEEEGPAAPPTSPFPLRSHSNSASYLHKAKPLLSKRKKKKKEEEEVVVGEVRRGGGGGGGGGSTISVISSWVAADAGSDSEVSQDSEDGSRAGKLRVQVYLPQVVPEAADEDLRTCMLEGRPAIVRERHLSYTDLRGDRRQVEGGGEERHGCREGEEAWGSAEVKESRERMQLEGGRQGEWKKALEAGGGRVEVAVVVDNWDSKRKLTPARLKDRASRGRESGKGSTMTGGAKSKEHLKPVLPHKVTITTISSSSSTATTTIIPTTTAISSMARNGRHRSAGQGLGVDLAIDASKACSGPRAPLHTHPVTVLKADSAAEDAAQPE